jgi:hypothetical protein
MLGVRGKQPGDRGDSEQAGRCGWENSAMRFACVGFAPINPSDDVFEVHCGAVFAKLCETSAASIRSTVTM